MDFPYSRLDVAVRLRKKRSEKPLTADGRARSFKRRLGAGMDGHRPRREEQWVSGRTKCSRGENSGPSAGWRRRFSRSRQSLVGPFVPSSLGVHVRARLSGPSSCRVKLFHQHDHVSPSKARFGNCTVTSWNSHGSGVLLEVTADLHQIQMPVRFQRPACHVLARSCPRVRQSFRPSSVSSAPSRLPPVAAHACIRLIGACLAFSIVTYFTQKNARPQLSTVVWRGAME